MTTAATLRRRLAATGLLRWTALLPELLLCRRATLDALAGRRLLAGIGLPIFPLPQARIAAALPGRRLQAGLRLFELLLLELGRRAARSLAGRTPPELLLLWRPGKVLALTVAWAAEVFSARVVVVATRTAATRWRGNTTLALLTPFVVILRREAWAHD